MNPYLEFAGVVIGLFITDFIWTELVVAVNKKRALVASALSVAFTVLAGAVTIAYVHKPILLVAAGIGAFAGTYASIKRTKP